MIKTFRIFLPTEHDEKLMSRCIIKYDDKKVNTAIDKISLCLGATYKSCSDLKSLEGFRVRVVKNPTTTVKRNQFGEVISTKKFPGVYEGFSNEDEIIHTLLSTGIYTSTFNVPKHSSDSYEERSVIVNFNFCFHELYMYLNKNPNCMNDPKFMHLLRAYLNNFNVENEGITIGENYVLGNYKDSLGKEVYEKKIELAKENKHVLSIRKKLVP